MVYFCMKPILIEISPDEARKRKFVIKHDGKLLNVFCVTSSKNGLPKGTYYDMLIVDEAPNVVINGVEEIDDDYVVKKLYERKIDSTLIVVASTNPDHDKPMLPIGYVSDCCVCVNVGIDPPDIKIEKREPTYSNKTLKL